MSKSTLNILVLAVGGNVSQGILKALSKSTLDLHVVGADISPLQFGLYTVDKALISPWAHEASFLGWLLDTCKTEKIHAILSGAEPVLRVLAENKAFIESTTGASCIVSDAETLRIGDDKLLSCLFLQEHGYDTPAFAASEDTAAVEVLAEKFACKLIAKPRTGGGARGHIRINSSEDLSYAMRRPGYLIQEFLPEDEQEFTVGCFHTGDGDLLNSIVMWRELHEGTTYRAIVGEHPGVRDYAESIARTLRTLGPCNIQLRLTQRGPVCFEINPRFSGTTPFRAHLGYNEVEVALRCFVLKEKDTLLPLVTKGIILRYWNEIYVNQEAFESLRDGHQLEKPRTFGLDFEKYGMRP